MLRGCRLYYHKFENKTADEEATDEEAEETPDTTIRLVTKNIIIVKEPMADVTKKIYEYRAISGSSVAKIIPNIGDL